jgi:hypothetical protein
MNTNKSGPITTVIMMAAVVELLLLLISAAAAIVVVVVVVVAAAAAAAAVAVAVVQGGYLRTPHYKSFGWTAKFFSHQFLLVYLGHAVQLASPYDSKSRRKFTKNTADDRSISCCYITQVV